MSCEDKGAGAFPPRPDQTGGIPGAAGQGHAHYAEHAAGILSQTGMHGAAQNMGGMDKGGMDNGGRPGPDTGQPHAGSWGPGAAQYQGPAAGSPGPWGLPGPAHAPASQAAWAQGPSTGQQGGASGCDCGKDGPPQAGGPNPGGQVPFGQAAGHGPQQDAGPQYQGYGGPFPPGQGPHVQPSAPWSQELGPHYAPWPQYMPQGMPQAQGHAPGHAPGYAPGHAPGYSPGHAPGFAQGHAPGPSGGPSGAWRQHHGGPSGSSCGHGGGNHYGELYGLIREAANGQPDVSRFLNYFQSVSSDFWKGALVGTGLTLLLTNDAVKDMLSKGLAGLWGLVGAGAEDLEAEEDRKAEEQAAKEGTI